MLSGKGDGEPAHEFHGAGRAKQPGGVWDAADTAWCIQVGEGMLKGFCRRFGGCRSLTLYV